MGLNEKLNEELNKYTPHQIEELYKEILIKKDQLEIANKRIIKSIQKNEEKADNIFNEIKRLRTMNLNIIKGIPVNLITEQDLLTKNINMRIKFFENPKDIESDLENKDIGKLFRKNYVYLKKGIKN
jgi:CO dehydrogenase/acetyl-CoA synthase beta subunit